MKNTVCNIAVYEYTNIILLKKIKLVIKLKIILYNFIINIIYNIIIL